MGLSRRNQCISLSLISLSTGCNAPRIIDIGRPSVAPATQPASAPTLSAGNVEIRPIYREIMAIDLPTILRVAAAQNLDIRLAARRVEANRGRMESVQGAVFPVLSPTATFEHTDGTVRAVQGNLVGVGFDTLQVYATLQMVLNPGRVVYDIIAARKRLAASEHDARAVQLETLRLAATQYYELVLGRARLAAAQQAVVESEELLRINRLRARAGTGVRADELRAEAELAGRQQDLALSLNAFYNTSIALTLTLHLDSAVTLAPNADDTPAITLVRDDLTLDELLGLAIQHRPDLDSVRTLVDAADADRKSAWWAALGAQFNLGYQYGGITGHADNVIKRSGVPSNLILNPYSKDGSFSTDPYINNTIKNQIAKNSQKQAGTSDKTFVFSDQERLNATAAWRFSVTAIGDLKTAGAVQSSAALEADRRLDQVRAQVVQAYQASKTHAELIPYSSRQSAAAEEALRLTQANLRAGTMTTLDVLQAEDTVAASRVRYAEAIVRYNQSQVNVLAAVGLLDDSRLAVGHVTSNSGSTQ